MWRKLWTSPPDPPLKTIQVPIYDYLTPDIDLARREADKIERHIKEQFRDWRRGQLTRYKTDVAAQMRQLLLHFEKHQMTVGPTLSPQEVSAIEVSFISRVVQSRK